MTERVGIIGWPLTTTLSPAMHNAAFQALGMDWHYDAMPIPPDILRLGVREPKQHGYIGINVTTPHKETVMQHVTPDTLARAVGAVNTIDFRTETGTNTDVRGFIEDLRAHQLPLDAARALVLGAGGAAKAAVYGLTQAGAEVVVVNRTFETARRMVANLALHHVTMRAEVTTLDEAVETELHLIVNCTTAGMYGSDTPWIDGVPYPAGVPLYDMVYQPAITPLMSLAEAHGGRAVGGLGMLVRQGAAAFELWTGRSAPLDIMFQAARAALDENR